MAGLPHWRNSTAATKKYEPLYLNQFEVIITPPPAVAQAIGYGDNLMLEHVKKIEGLPELAATGKLAEQTYKFAKRMYAPAKPVDTIATLKIDFEVNLNDDNDMYIYNALRAWADLVYDPLTGAQGLKRDYADAIISVNIFNRVGDIYRQFDFTPVFIGPDKMSEMKLDYSSDEIFRLQATFTADTFTETRIGAVRV
jgi:hypothetical protein